MSQALVLSFPAQDQSERIRREVAAILSRHAGRARAIHRGALAREVRRGLGLDHLTVATLERRVRESISDLLEDGTRVVCSGSGIFLAESADEIAEGDKALAGNAFGALRRLASYRRQTLAETLRLLGQRSLELGEP